MNDIQQQLQQFIKADGYADITSIRKHIGAEGQMSAHDLFDDIFGGGHDSEAADQPVAEPEHHPLWQAAIDHNREQDEKNSTVEATVEYASKTFRPGRAGDREMTRRFDLMSEYAQRELVQRLIATLENAESIEDYDTRISTTNRMLFALKAIGMARETDEMRFNIDRALRFVEAGAPIRPLTADETEEELANRGL